MKKIVIVLTVLLSCIFISSCQSPHGKVTHRDSVVVDPLDSVYWDSIQVANLGYHPDIIDNFFKDFQEKNDGWIKTEQGHKKLVAAFKKKMTTDIEFAKACANNTFSGRGIVYSESIAPYKKNDGEEGELKAFDFVIDMPLIKPLYNGKKTIYVKYEIISAIPSTVEDHDEPYIKNVNYCSTFDSFLKNSYDGTLNLGCYIITNLSYKK